RPSGPVASMPDRRRSVRGVAAIVRLWADEHGEELARNFDPERARSLLDRFGNAFSEGYRENYPPATAVADIRVIEGLTPSRPLGVDFHRRDGDQASSVGLKVWSHGRPIALSERVPVLENMGFKVVDERTYLIACAASPLPSPSPHGPSTARAHTP